MSPRSALSVSLIRYTTLRSQRLTSVGYAGKFAETFPHVADQAEALLMEHPLPPFPPPPAKKVSKYGGFSLLRWPQESGKSTLMPVEFVPGYNNDRDFYASQIPVVYQKAIAYYEQRQQSSKGFVAAYQQARTAELERHPNDSPWEQQYAIETRLWGKYVGPPHGTSDAFTCPDPKPCLQGNQPGKCEVCARPGHWWWECQEPCINCGSPRHQFPVCAQGLWWIVKKREILEAKSRSKSQPQPQPRPVEEEFEGVIEEVD